MEIFKLIGRINLDGIKQVQKDMKKISDKAEEMGDSFKNVGEKMSAAITLPLVGLGAGAIASATNFENAQARIDSSLGITEDRANDLMKVAEDLYKGAFGEDLNDVATRVSNVNQVLGDLPADEIAKVTEQAFILEEKFGADMQETIRASKGLMDTFGYTSEEAMDRLAWGFSNNLDYSGEFLDTLNEYGGYFSQLGFEGDDMFLRLQSGAENGAFQLDKVGDAMKEFSLRSRDIDASGEAFESLGLDAEEMVTSFNKGGEGAQASFKKVAEALMGVEDETERNKLAVELFGTQYEDLGDKAFNSLLSVEDGMEGVDGATEKIGDKLNTTFGAELTKLWRGAETSLKPLGDTLTSMAQEWLPKIGTAIQNLGTWWSGLNPNVQQTLIVLGGVLALIGPLLIVIGTLIPVVVNLVKVFKMVRLAVLGMNTAFLANPITWIIVAIVALIAIGVLLWKNWDTVKAKLLAAWDAIKIKWDYFVFQFKSKINELKAQATQKMNDIRNAITNKISEAVSNAKRKFSEITSAITTPISNAYNKVKGWVSKITGLFNWKWSIPKPKLPKISVNMRKNSWGIPYPDFDISWFAKGGIFDGPSVIGVGEGTSREAVVPLEGRYMKPFAQEIARQMPSNVERGNSGVIEVPLYLDGREVARAIAPNMDKQLERERRITRRGRG